MASVLRKHPRKGKVLERVPILEPAWEVLQRQPRDGDFVFPFGGSTLSKYFTRACRDLSIPDLHLHDLRHEGTSSLFEQGYEIQQVALVTGHKDWRNLKRYTNLRPEDVHNVKPPRK
jgi:integrase